MSTTTGDHRDTHHAFENDDGQTVLEFYSDSDGEARRVPIEKYPFRIGRAESADLRVESVEVSREHAEITERNGMWLVRDLGSTNGTKSTVSRSRRCCSPTVTS